LTIDQAAILLQMTPENLRKLCRQGKIPAMQLGSEWRISKDSIREQLQSKPA
jgi:excisionase family DNA binding protein